MLVGTVVVDDAVHVETFGHRLVNLAQERQKLLVPVTRLAGGQYRAVEHIQGRKQRGGAVTDIVMRNALNVTEAHRQHGLRALKRLTLAFLVYAQHQRVLWGTQVQADHVAQFLDEERVGRQFEASAAVRLEAQQFEVSMDAGRRDCRLRGNCAYAPMRGAVSRLGMQRLVNQLGHPLVIDRARLAGPHFVVQTVDALFKEPGAPFTHRGARELQAPGNLAIWFASGRSQDNACPCNQCSRNRARTRHRSKLRLFGIAQRQLHLRSPHRHAGISRFVDTNILRKHSSVNNGTAH